jgi:hypothetical protein
MDKRKYHNRFSFILKLATLPSEIECEDIMKHLNQKRVKRVNRINVYYTQEPKEVYLVVICSPLSTGLHKNYF